MFGVLKIGRLGASMKKAGFNPRALFSASEPGAWYDPSDMSTLFQDNAGTVPVTAVGQPVGFILDKRLGLARSPLSIVGKTAGDGVVTVVGNVITVTGGTSSTDVSFSSAYSFILLDLTFSAANGIAVYAGGYPSTATAGRNTYRGAAGMYNIIRVPAGAPTTTITVHDAYNIIGNHANQATATARPVLQQDGNGKYYLAFDGVDDSMATAAINFTATDKMTVWAGVTALDMGCTSGATHQLLYSNGDNFNGFGLRTPNSPGNITFVSSGSTALAEPSESGLGAAPRSMVICGVGDQSAPLSQIRRDGVLRATVTDVQGASGGYGNRAMWIGSQAGASRFFNGSLYSLIVRGAQSSLSQIEATELYMKKKVGIA